MNPLVNSISGRLSLRKPQRESLEILDRITEIIPLRNSLALDAALGVIKSEYPHFEEFERDFPSLCFALATGVGKTRLMGAFITYLYVGCGIRNFFVLAPNLTIYNKLITDFTPNTPKYVFRGIAEFAVNPPLVVTGDTFEGLTNTLLDAENACRINVFNISKINSEVKGGKAPRIRKLSEYIGISYFDYLASLPDLVLLMDESHRYRATAGVRAINELNPILGLELTATPQVETPKGPIRFKNVIYDYPLSAAMDDGFVKEPAAATKENFSTFNMSPAAIEEIKLHDGIALHEKVKAELEAYAINNNVKRVKPFVLIIARDTTHAAQLLNLIQSDQFADGDYKDKVIQVDSSTKEDEVIARLLRVEDVEEPTEIVIHVNMLKEGWDVTNLYTIIPLRAASARTLVEQSIGRGLRLPYGKRTGVSIVDTLNIIAHDRFQEIIDEARKGDSPINLKTVMIGENEGTNKSKTGTSKPIFYSALALANDGSITKNTSDTFSSEELPVAQAAYQIISRLGSRPDIVPNSNALLRTEVQAAIEKEVISILPPEQGRLSLDGKGNRQSIANIVAKTVELIHRKTIDIPQIQVIPRGAVSIKFDDFILDLKPFSSFNPTSDTILVQGLHSSDRQTYNLAEDAMTGSASPSDEIVDILSSYNDIAYEEHAELLYNLANELVGHLATYLSSSDLISVVKANGKTIASGIYRQMQQHLNEQISGGYDVKISRGYTPIRVSAFTTLASEDIVDYKQAPRQLSEIKKYVYGGFKRCLQDYLKFDSNTERILSVILDSDSEKWLRPAKGQFSITYLKEGVYTAYEPDFLAETADSIIILEPKDHTAIDDSYVIAKAEAAHEYCKRASTFAEGTGGKKWKYLLIPDIVIAENKTLGGLVKEYEYKSGSN